MIVKLLTEHNLEFLSLKGGCKMPYCWKSHALTPLYKKLYIPRRFRFPFLLLILETTFDGLGVPPENR